MRKLENTENEINTNNKFLNVFVFFKNKDIKFVHYIFLGILILVWQIVVQSGLIKEFILPKPSEVVKTFFIILPEVKDHLLITIHEALLGFVIAIVLSALLAFMMDSVKLVRDAVYPLLVISQTIPIIALAPLFALWFGFGLLPKIIVVVLVCFFPVVISLYDGLISVDKDMINLLRSMGASRVQIYSIIKLPASMISLFSGLRIAATYSIMGAVIAEWLGGSKGLGVYMIRVKHSYNYEKMFAVILMIVILSMLVFKIIDLLQNIIMPWNKKIKEN